MAKTIRTKVFSFDELNEKAKEVAIQWYRNEHASTEFYPSDEILESIKKGLEHFGARLKDYSIDWGSVNRSHWKIEIDHNYDQCAEISGVRLYKYIVNNGYLSYKSKFTGKKGKTLDGNCPFTGVTYDESFIDPIRAFMKLPTNITYEELLNDCVHETIKDGCNEYEFRISDEGITEELKANDSWYFTRDGKIFNH